MLPPYSALFLQVLFSRAGGKKGQEKNSKEQICICCINQQNDSEVDPSSTSLLLAKGLCNSRSTRSALLGKKARFACKSIHQVTVTHSKTWDLISLPLTPTDVATCLYSQQPHLQLDFGTQHITQDQRKDWQGVCLRVIVTERVYRGKSLPAAQNICHPHDTTAAAAKHVPSVQV